MALTDTKIRNEKPGADVIGITHAVDSTYGQKTVAPPVSQGE